MLKIVCSLIFLVGKGRFSFKWNTNLMFCSVIACPVKCCSFISAPPKCVNKEELHACTQYLFMALEDRNVDVRKGASEAVLPFMIHLGYEGMLKHTSKVKV